MNPMKMQFTSHEPPVLSPTELALYGKLDTVRMMVNSAIRRFVNDHRELLSGRVLDYGAGKPGSCRIPQPFRHLIGAKDYCAWEPGNESPFTCLEYWEGILCTQVIQNVDDCVFLFRSFAGSLKPGGHLVLTYPVAWQEIEQELWRFTQHGVWALCHQAGLVIVDHRSLAEVNLDGVLPLSLVNGMVAVKR